MYGKYTIALCDILGFSRLVNSTELGELVEDGLGWFRKALHHSLHKNDFPEETPTLSELQAHSSIGMAWFSDTVLLYTRDDTDDHIRELFETLGWLLFETMLHPPTRLRAGISYGEAFIDPENSMYIGSPIVEAYRLEKSQQWSGASLTKKAVERLPAIARTGEFTDWWLVPYAVPLKGGSICKTLAINWTTGFHLPGTFLPWSPESAEPTELDWSDHRDVCEKWQNTKRFHDHTCRYCRS